MSEAENAMLDMVKEIRRMTAVFEEAHSDMRKKDVRAGIMTCLLGVFVEYSVATGMPMREIRRLSNFALDKYEEFI